MKSDFKDQKDAHDSIFDLSELNKKLNLKPEDYERLEYRETIKSEYKEGAHICNIQIKYKKELISSSSPLTPTSSKKIATNHLQPSATEKITCSESYPTESSHKNSESTSIPEKTPEEQLKEICSMENKFWRGIPMEIIVEHFKVLTITKNSNGDVYLTTKQLISFLKKGFLEDTEQPVQKINCSAGEKGFIIKRFYQLYDLSVAQYCHPARKAKFIKLFTDCFSNWDYKSIESLFKPNKVKENWE